MADWEEGRQARAVPPQAHVRRRRDAGVRGGRHAGPETRRRGVAGALRATAATSTRCRPSTSTAVRPPTTWTPRPPRSPRPTRTTSPRRPTRPRSSKRTKSPKAAPIEIRGRPGRRTPPARQPVSADDDRSALLEFGQLVAHVALVGARRTASGLSLLGREGGRPLTRASGGSAGSLRELGERALDALDGGDRQPAVPTVQSVDPERVGAPPEEILWRDRLVGPGRWSLFLRWPTSRSRSSED